MERSEEPGGNPASAKMLMNGVLPEMGVSDAENSSMLWMKANASGERDPSFHSTSYPATDWQYKHSEENLTQQHATIRLIMVGPEGFEPSRRDFSSEGPRLSMFIFCSMKNLNMTDPPEYGSLQLLNVVAFLATVAMNGLANALPLNGRTTAELSDMYPNLFVPAGYVFAIWGVIYLLLLVFAVYQASIKRRREEFLGRIGYYFALSAVANISWLFLWHYEQVLLSVIPMFVLLGSLIMIYIRLDVGRWERSREDRLLISLPFSVYLGWITVAPIANVTAALVKLNWDGFGLGEATWTVLMIGVAVLLTGIVIYTRTDIGYSLVIAWALGGIYAKQRAIPSIFTASLIGIVVILGLLVATSLGLMGQHRKSREPSGIMEEMNRV
jgi:hypothetical protein